MPIHKSGLPTIGLPVVGGTNTGLLVKDISGNLEAGSTLTYNSSNQTLLINATADRPHLTVGIDTVQTSNNSEYSIHGAVVAGYTGNFGHFDAVQGVKLISKTKGSISHFRNVTSNPSLSAFDQLALDNSIVPGCLVDKGDSFKTIFKGGWSNKAQIQILVGPNGNSGDPVVFDTGAQNLAGGTNANAPAAPGGGAMWGFECHVTLDTDGSNTLYVSVRFDYGDPSLAALCPTCQTSVFPIYELGVNYVYVSIWAQTNTSAGDVILNPGALTDWRPKGDYGI